jgi:hypothetical protein
LFPTSKEEFAVLQLSRKFHQLIQAQIIAIVAEKTCLLETILEIFILQKTIGLFAIYTGLSFPS